MLLAEELHADEGSSFGCIVDHGKTEDLAASLVGLSEEKVSRPGVTTN